MNNGSEYAKTILNKYKTGTQITEILVELTNETEKGPIDGSINLSTDENVKPNVKPWNTLGLYLNEIRNYGDAKQLWETMLKVAYKTAQNHYGGIAQVGTPYNNLAVTLSMMGKHNDAFISIFSAYTYDITIGNPHGAARPNFERYINFYREIIYSKKTPEFKIDGKKGKRGTEISVLVKSIGGILIFLAFAFSSYMLWLYPSQWHFALLIGVGFILFLILYTNKSFGFKDFWVGEPSPPELDEEK